MARNIVPTTNLGESLGTPTKKWNALHVGAITTDTIGDGVDTLVINDLINGVGFKTWTMSAGSNASVNNFYVKKSGGGFTNTAPFIVPITGKIKVIAAARNPSSPNSAWNVEIRTVPALTTIATLSLGSSEDTKVDDTFNVQVTKGDLLAIYIDGGTDQPSVTALIFED